MKLQCISFVAVCTAASALSFAGFLPLDDALAKLGEKLPASQIEAIRQLEKTAAVLEKGYSFGGTAKTTELMRVRGGGGFTLEDADPPGIEEGSFRIDDQYPALRLRSTLTNWKSLTPTVTTNPLVGVAMDELHHPDVMVFRDKAGAETQRGTNPEEIGTRRMNLVVPSYTESLHRVLVPLAPRHAEPFFVDGKESVSYASHDLAADQLPAFAVDESSTVLSARIESPTHLSKGKPLYETITWRISRGDPVRLLEAKYVLSGGLQTHHFRFSDWKPFRPDNQAIALPLRVTREAWIRDSTASAKLAVRHELTIDASTIAFDHTAVASLLAIPQAPKNTPTYNAAPVQISKETPDVAIPPTLLQASAAVAGGKGRAFALAGAVAGLLAVVAIAFLTRRKSGLMRANP